ncbi:hypothetical protein F5I97DRAFT_1807228 [Phlebopus sp. FC_14]|nr:hypothetical protein F5I97DRAFT_1807228 [Phlebopus sp. FC_14]
MPYPQTRPDRSVFEDLTDEYTSVSAPASVFTPLTSSDALASLVLKGEFRAAESLREEMLLHRIPITYDVVYIQAALDAITKKRPKGAVDDRPDLFEAWLSLVPDAHEQRNTFTEVRHLMFRNMDYLNLQFICRFGLILGSKGYCAGNASMQVVSVLARYACPSVTEAYLRQLEEKCRSYHARVGSGSPEKSLSRAYNLAIRTLALAGRTKATLRLIHVAKERDISILDFTLSIASKTSPKQDVDHKSPALRPTSTIAEASPDSLARRLWLLRKALTSHSPPSPYALLRFITDYRTEGRTRGTTLLRGRAYRHSAKSASTWAMAEMLYHRAREEHIYTLIVFAQHFHLIGVPGRSVLSRIRGQQGKSARQGRSRRLKSPSYPISEKLYPTRHHTALVWEALVKTSPKAERERLYSLLLKLVQGNLNRDQLLAAETSQPLHLQLPANAFDAAHFAPFIQAHAKRDPKKASLVMNDMVNLGIQPQIVQWSMVARGYAQHGNPSTALRILDWLEDSERKQHMDDKPEREERLYRPSDLLLGTCTNVLRGFVAGGDAENALEVERRLIERFGYVLGERRATDAAITSLRMLKTELTTRFVDHFLQMPPHCS